MESGISDDYAIPPDAMSCGEDSTEWSSLVLRLNLNGAAVVADSPSRCAKTGVLDKSGHLAKLGGKLKTWRRRFFVLSNGKLRYWKTQVNNDTQRLYFHLYNSIIYLFRVSILSQCSFALSCIFDPSCSLNYFYPYNLKWNLI